MLHVVRSIYLECEVVISIHAYVPRLQSVPTTGYGLCINSGNPNLANTGPYAHCWGVNAAGYCILCSDNTCAAVMATPSATPSNTITPGTLSPTPSPTASASFGAPLYAPYGPQANVATSSVTSGGWMLCFNDLYSDQSEPQLSNILAACNGPFLMLACGQAATPGTLTTLAWGARADVLFETGSNGQNAPHSVAGVAWYYDPDWSWGFAVPGDGLSLNACDTATGQYPQYRLCWHTVIIAGDVGFGYRCGATVGLNGAANWARYIFTAGPNVSSSPTPSNSQTPPPPSATRSPYPTPVGCAASRCTGCAATCFPDSTCNLNTCDAGYNFVLTQLVDAQCQGACATTITRLG